MAEPTPAAKPLFRQEALEHRRVRHLGELVLLRPLSLRLVTLSPLLVLAVMGYALSRLEFQPMFVALGRDASAVERGAPGLELSLAPDVAQELHRGQEVEFRLAGAAERSRGVISELATVPCDREARAFQLSALDSVKDSAKDTCLRMRLVAHPALAPLPAPQPVQVWTAPRNYLLQLFRG